MTDECIGSTFESFLQEEGVYEEVLSTATKRVVAWQLENAMRLQNINKLTMAKRMKTSRAQLDRVLDPNNRKVQLDTIEKAAEAVGRRLKIELI